MFDCAIFLVLVGILHQAHSLRSISSQTTWRSNRYHELLMASQKVATIDSATLWRIQMNLEKAGNKVVEAVARVRFIEEQGYEPPQGRIFVEDDFYGILRVDEKGYASRWTLSEDKNDRKDGLWIWGLWAEPKYPFLYFSLGIFKSIVLPSGLEDPIFGGEGVPGDRLDIRFSHERDETTGAAMLSEGIMTYKVSELVKADFLGLGGSVEVGDDIPAGRITIRPVYPSSDQEVEDEKLMETIEQGIKQQGGKVV